MSTGRCEAAIVTIGSELTLGLRLDTNTRQIASALSRNGYRVREAVSVADDVGSLADTLSRLCSSCGLVVVTGGLGPTHDDVTREAASVALGLESVRDPDIAKWLADVACRHGDPAAAEQVYKQADVLLGAQVIRPTTGTAPGQIVPTPAGRLVLLPGPPHEMEPMLQEAIGGEGAPIASTIRCVGISESDAQVLTERVLVAYEGVSLTVLARPSLVDVILVDRGAGESRLLEARDAVESALDEHVYARGEDSLAHAVVDSARDSGLTIAVAESCTGGMLGAALTDVPGSSDVFVGGIIGYSNAAKSALLGVGESLIAQHGAVSEQTAMAMAEGAARETAADLAISITGIAGPAGGSAEKPVGLVWFGLWDRGTITAHERTFYGNRNRIRTRATIAALDKLRRTAGG